MSNPRADILVRRPDGAILAVVEVKNLPRIAAPDAMRLRDALVSFGFPAELARYLLIITQDRGFIWEANGDGQWARQPESFDMTPVLREFLTEAELQRHLRGTELEIAVAHWLADLSRGRGLPRDSLGGAEGLARFLTDIRGAEVQPEALA